MKSTLYFFLCIISQFVYCQKTVVDDVTFKGSIESIHVVDTCRGKDIKYTFDKKQLVIETVNDGQYAGRSVNIYNGNHLVAEQQFLDGIVKYQLIHQFHNNNLINTKELVGDTIKSEEKYSYKDNQLVEMQQIYKGSIDNTQRYRYDKKSGLKETLSLSNGHWVIVTREYNTKVSEIIEHYPHSDTLPYYRSLTKYNKKGQIVEVRNWQNGEENGCEIREYTKNILKARKHYNAKGEIQVDYGYDEKGNWSNSTNYHSGDKLVLKNIYDKKGNVVKIEVSQNGEYICTVDYYIKYR